MPAFSFGAAHLPSDHRQHHPQLHLDRGPRPPRSRHAPAPSGRCRDRKLLGGVLQESLTHEPHRSRTHVQTSPTYTASESSNAIDTDPTSLLRQHPPIDQRGGGLPPLAGLRHSEGPGSRRESSGATAAEWVTRTRDVPNTVPSAFCKNSQSSRSWQAAPRVSLIQ